MTILSRATDWFGNAILSFVSPPGQIEPTVRGRYMQYRRRQHLTIWIGTGFGGIVVLYATMFQAFTGTSVPPALLAVVPGLVVIGIACFAMARSQFEWRADFLERKMALGESKPESHLTSDEEAWPLEAEFWYDLERYALYMAAIAFLILVGWLAYAA